MITDEIWGRFTDALADTGTMRAALEAVAPMIAAEALGRAYNTARAQGMREAAKIYHFNDEWGRWNYFEAAENAILARAQELEPK